MHVSDTGHDMFCPGVSLLHDGRVLVSGGESYAHVSVYDAATATWNSEKQLNIPRAYEVRMHPDMPGAGMACMLHSAFSGHRHDGLSSSC